MSKRWDRKKYPPNWEELSENCRKQAGYTCQDCGYERGQPKKSKAGNTWYDPLDASHDIPNDTANPNSPLTCRCKRCHRLYDNLFPIEEWRHVERMNAIAMEKSGYVWCDHEDCGGYYLPHEH